MGTTVDEIAYYCEEENTFGALLLSGDWGCGKTYLLEHDLPERLGSGYVMLRLSLFGETSVEAIRKKIQKEYFNKILEQIGKIQTRREAAASFPAAHGSGLTAQADADTGNSDLTAQKDVDTGNSGLTAQADADAGNSGLLVPEDIPGAMDSANAWIYKAGDLSGIEKIFAHNPSEYIKLEPQILGCRVILIFDDLERCHLSQAEALGCINEYCENLHLKTIIVANEEKIKDWQTNKTKNQEDGKKDFLAYSEIKEKIVARTVHLAADYDVIITNIFDGYRTNVPGYVEFLQFCKDAAVALINDCEIQNIRSLRCGFQDFEKIFPLCKAEGLPDTEIRKYFTSFVLFVLLAKGGRVTKSLHFGYGLNKLQQKYPGHYAERYMPTCVKDWVLTGVWPEEEVVAELRKNAVLQQRTAEPQNLIRSMNLLEMDDETVAGGWEAYLALAYDGQLTLDEYVRLLRNLVSAREYAYTWPVEPDVEKLAAGVECAFRRICAADTVPMQLRDRMEESVQRKCTDAERKIYGRIVFFNDSRAYLYGLNRTRVLAALRSKSDQEVFKCRGLDLNRFDDEMGEAVVACYLEQDSNQRRIAFIDSIRKILWSAGANCSYGDMDTFHAIEELKTKIAEIRAGEEKMPLRAITSNYFLSQIDEVLAAWEKN